jgi:hypothetical protein
VRTNRVIIIAEVKLLKPHSKLPKIKLPNKILSADIHEWLLQLPSIKLCDLNINIAIVEYEQMCIVTLSKCRIDP